MALPTGYVAFLSSFSFVFGSSKQKSSEIENLYVTHSGKVYVSNFSSFTKKKNSTESFIFMRIEEIRCCYQWIQRSTFKRLLSFMERYQMTMHCWSFESDEDASETKNEQFDQLIASGRIKAFVLQKTRATRAIGVQRWANEMWRTKNLKKTFWISTRDVTSLRSQPWIFDFLFHIESVCTCDVAIEVNEGLIRIRSGPCWFLILSFLTDSHQNQHFYKHKFSISIFTAIANDS